MPADLSDLRLDLMRRSKWNIGYFVAGLALWIAVLVTNLTVPIETGRFIWIALSFGVLPIAVLVSKVGNADPFCNDNSLGRLVGYTHMSVISLSFPILIVTAVYDPHIQLLAMAILFLFCYGHLDTGYAPEMAAGSYVKQQPLLARRRQSSRTRYNFCY